jgi:hypothetical protein
MREVEWLCRNGYPRNKRTLLVTKFRNRLKEKILAYLKKTNTYVNKRIFDIIMMSGFFERVNNRAGNKYSPYQKTRENALPLDHTQPSEYRKLKLAVEDTMNEYNIYDLIEGYGKRNTVNHNVVYVGTLILLIVIYIWIMNSRLIRK